METKAVPQTVEIEELPDAWERFERAFDTVIKAPAERKRALLPKAKKRPATKGGGPRKVKARS